MWVEAELQRELGGVQAPAELWDRIELGAAPRDVRQPRPWAVWSLAAIAALLALFFVIPQREFRSADAAQIRQWVKSNTGFDVPLVGSAAVRLVSAKRSGDGAEIACRVGDRAAKLIVSKAPGGAAAVGGHQSYVGRKAVSWSMRGQFYTLACASPEDLLVACALCHAGGVRPVG